MSSISKILKTKKKNPAFSFTYITPYTILKRRLGKEKQGNQFLTLTGQVRYTNVKRGSIFLYKCYNWKREHYIKKWGEGIKNGKANKIVVYSYACSIIPIDTMTKEKKIIILNIKDIELFSTETHNRKLPA